MPKPVDTTKDVARWKAIRDEIEEHYQLIINAYYKYDLMSKKAKLELERKWQSYYKQVASTQSAQLYTQMSDLVSQRRSESRYPYCDLRIYKLRMKAKQMLANNEFVYIKKPSSYDPMEFINSEVVRKHKLAIKKIKELALGESEFSDQVREFLT